MDDLRLDHLLMTHDEHPLGERVAHLESWSLGHEGQCAERQRSIMGQLDDIQDDARKSRHMLIACLIGLLGWSCRELWSTRSLAAVTAVVSSAAAAKPHGH